METIQREEYSPHLYHDYLLDHQKRLLAFDLPETANDRDLYLVCRREQAERSPVKDFVEFLGRFYANGPKS